ncbi:MAG: hypothetical protein LQ338_005868 [Usnochroma carphineum]|nr:MAG: hypothetical protein LQ338_005868 [Usnochroma carphineum]
MSPPRDLPPAYRFAVLQGYIARFNTRIKRIDKLLSTTQNLDLTLGTLSYTLSLLHSLLPYSSITTTRYKPNSTPLLSRLSSSLPPLSNLLSETRTILRLFSLLSLYTSALSTFRTDHLFLSPSSKPESSPQPQDDRILTHLARLQLISGTIFQVLENLAFLGDKAVVRIPWEKRARMWLWCSRAWGVSVGLELGRLGREWVLRPLFFGEDDEGSDKEDDEGEGGQVSDNLSQKRRRDGPRRKAMMEKWRREVLVNACFAPMTLHYSVEGGLLGEGWLSLLGAVASWLSLREAWRETGRL